MSQKGQWKDFSIASMSGASQQLVPAQNGIVGLLIHNPDATNSLAFTINGTAALNTGGSCMLAPGGYLLLDAIVCTNAIQVMGNSGSGVTCWLFNPGGL